MLRQVPFIGRKDELTQIKNFIEEQNTRRVLCILGLGGIGKTRLLAEIHSRYTRHEASSLLVADIIDFDDRTLHLPRNIERQIAHQLDQSAFEPYLRGLQDLFKMEAVGVSSQALEQQAERVRQTFVENFNEVSSNKHVVLLFDTVEKLENEEAWNALSKSMFASKNALFVLTGRPDKEWWTSLQTQLGADTKIIELEPLKEESGQQYLKQKQRLLHVNLEPQLESKLLFLAGGRPILLDLAIEWISRHLPLDWMTTHSLEELQSFSDEKITKYKEQFETQLVSKIIEIRRPMDQLTLVMSRIYPLTPAMLVKLLRIPEDEAQQLFNEAQSYVFVKSLPDGRISLHDEMRRMVNEYVWPEVDLQRIRRRRDSKIAARLFSEEDKRLKERLTEKETGDLGGLFERAALARSREIINQQWIEHALYSNVESGFDVWKSIVDERRRENEFSFAKSLLDLAASYYDDFTLKEQFDFDLLKARLTNDTGQVRKAEEMLNELLKKNREEPEREAELYNALALVEEKLGKLSEALDNQLKSLAIFEKINPKLVPLVANRVGYIYRLLGKLQEAEKHYKLALESALAVEAERRARHLIASLLNNLGYVYGLQGKYNQMDFYCHQALGIWEEIGSASNIGRTENTIAIFLRDRGEYNEAIDLLKITINRYEEPDDHEELCRAYLDLGWTQLYKAEIVNKKETDIRYLKWNVALLNQAKDSIETSRHFAERYGLEAFLPSILHLSAVVHWYLGQALPDSSLSDQAYLLNAASYKKSEQIGDIRYMISCLLADAEWDYERGKYDQIPIYIQKLEQYERQEYPLHLGRMLRIEADIAFIKGNFDLAFAKYAKGLHLIQQHGGFGRYSIERELSRLKNKMAKEMSITQINTWSIYLRQQWEQEDKTNPNLLTWCEQQILRAQLGSIG